MKLESYISGEGGSWWWFLKSSGNNEDIARSTPHRTNTEALTYLKLLAVASKKDVLSYELVQAAGQTRFEIYLDGELRAVSSESWGDEADAERAAQAVVSYFVSTDPSKA